MLKMCASAGFEGFVRDLCEPTPTMTVSRAPPGTPNIEPLPRIAAADGV